jgi:hypothetical protein
MPDYILHAQNGKVAIWDATGLVGAARMDPFNTPTDHMDRVFFHSDLQYLANMIEQTVVVNHTSLAGKTGTSVSGAPGLGTPAQAIANGNVRGLSIPLWTHSFGYAPPCFILHNGEILSGGTVIQSTSAGIRLASGWSNNTQVGLFETAFSSASALAAVSNTYKVIIFRALAGDPALPTFRNSKPDEELILGRKISDDARPLRVPILPGDAEFYVPLDPVLDIRNGALRSISPITGTTNMGFYTGSFFELHSVLMSNS